MQGPGHVSKVSLAYFIGRPNCGLVSLQHTYMAPAVNATEILEYVNT
jgi:hypothetical protein